MNRARILAIVWTIGILVACSIPGNDLPRLDFGMLSPDKVVHFFLFFGFGWLWLSAMPRTQPLRLAWVLIAGVLFAVGSEIYQGLLPWDRTPDPLDAVANLLGLLAAFAVDALVGRLRHARVGNFPGRAGSILTDVPEESEESVRRR